MAILGMVMVPMVLGWAPGSTVRLGGAWLVGSVVAG